MKRKFQCSNRNYHIQDIKDMQHKNVNISWGNWNFTRHPFSAEKFEIRGRNAIILNYHYRVYPKLDKGVCTICSIPCAYICCVAQLDKYCLPNCAQ